MNVNDVRILFEFNHWANRRLLAAARLLPAEDFSRDLRSSHASVQGTLIHIIGGHWVWLQLWRGEPSKEIVARCDAVWDPANFPDVPSLDAAHAALERDQIAFIHGLSDHQVTANTSFENFQGGQWNFSLGDQMQHVVNHSTYHRGQLVTLLRQLGQTPPGTDYTTFLLTRSAA